MHLDETMLQSNTAISLIEFIKRMYKKGMLMHEFDNEYNEILKRHEKALKARSRKYRIK